MPLMFQRTRGCVAALCSWLAIFTPMSTSKNAPAVPVLPAAYLFLPWLERAWLGLKALALGAGSKHRMVARTSVWRGCGGQLEHEAVSSAEAVLLAAGCRSGLLPKHG